GVDPVLVTMLSQRTKSELFGTYTLRVTCRLAALNPGPLSDEQMSWRLWPFCMQLGSWAAGCPGLKTRGDGSLTPWAPVMRSPLKPAKAFVRGTLIWR